MSQTHPGFAELLVAKLHEVCSIVHAIVHAWLFVCAWRRGTKHPLLCALACLPLVMCSLPCCLSLRHQMTFRSQLLLLCHASHSAWSLESLLFRLSACALTHPARLCISQFPDGCNALLTVRMQCKLLSLVVIEEFTGVPGDTSSLQWISRLATHPSLPFSG